MKKLGETHAGLALMSDDSHRLADERAAAAIRRLVARLDAGIAELQKTHDDTAHWSPLKTSLMMNAGKTASVS